MVVTLESHKWYYCRDHLCCLLLPHSTYSIRQFLVLVLFVGYCFGEMVCIWDSYVCQKVVLCFLIHKRYVRSIKRYCFVRQYTAIPVQLEIFILQYIGRCVLIIWTFIVNLFGCFCQFLTDNFGCYYYYYHHHHHHHVLFLTLVCVLNDNENCRSLQRFPLCMKEGRDDAILVFSTSEKHNTRRISP